MLRKLCKGYGHAYSIYILHIWQFSISLQVHNWLKPCVQQRNSTQGPAAIHIHKGELLNALASAGKPYSPTNVRSICNATPGVTADFRSNFGGGNREPSLKIPRDQLNQDQLNKIDSCKYIVVNKTL